MGTKLDVFLIYASETYNNDIPDNLGPVTEDSHGDDGALLVCSERELTEFGLFDSNFIVAVKSSSPEVFTPVGVLIIDHEQSQRTILAEGRSSSGARYRGSQNGCSLSKKIQNH